MDQLFEDVWLWELQRDEGVVGGEGGTQGEASLCGSCLRPTGQIHSFRKTVILLYGQYFWSTKSDPKITYNILLDFHTSRWPIQNKSLSSGIYDERKAYHNVFDFSRNTIMIQKSICTEFQWRPICLKNSSDMHIVITIVIIIIIIIIIIIVPFSWTVATY